MLNFKKTRILETSYDRLKSREITFQLTQGKSAKAGVFRWLQISMNIKDITIPLIIHYYLLKSIQNTTQIFPR